MTWRELCEMVDHAALTNGLELADYEIRLLAEDGWATPAVDDLDVDVQSQALVLVLFQ